MERLSRLPWVGSSTPRALVLLASRPDLLAPYFAPVWPVAAIFQGLTQYKLSPLPPLTWDYLRLMSTPNHWRHFGALGATASGIKVSSGGRELLV
jgi:hypothetical protein